MMLFVFISYLIRFPMFLFLVVKDIILYYLHKQYLIFDGWGLHLFVGKFGSGKTSAMVYKAWLYAKQYKDLTIVTNLKLQNFPLHTKILPLDSAEDILNAPRQSLVLIDEIGTIFNSRDFVGGAKSVPKILFQHLCQCRKRRLMILATTQRWNFLDKQLRDITAYVHVCKSHFGHPFTRISTVYKYDAPEYDLAYSNPLYPIGFEGYFVYLQTDKVRALYDTEELIAGLLDKEYVSDAEILANQGYTSMLLGDGDKRATNTAKRNMRKRL